MGEESTRGGTDESLLDLLNDTLQHLRLDATVDDLDVLSDAIEKSAWLRRQRDDQYVAGHAEGIRFTNAVRAQAKAAKQAVLVDPLANDPAQGDGMDYR